MTRSIKVEPMGSRVELPRFVVDRGDDTRAKLTIERCKDLGIPHHTTAGSIFVFGSHVMSVMGNFWETAYDVLSDREYVGISYKVENRVDFPQESIVAIAKHGSIKFDPALDEKAYMVAFHGLDFVNFPFWTNPHACYSGNLCGIKLTDEEVTVLTLQGFTVIPLPKFNKFGGKWGLPSDMKFDFSAPIYRRSYSSDTTVSAIGVEFI